MKESRISQENFVEVDPATLKPGQRAAMIEGRLILVGANGEPNLAHVTAQTQHIITGKVGSDMYGNPVPGSIPYATVITGEADVKITAGFLPETVVVPVPEIGSGGFTGVTVTADKMLYGTVAIDGFGQKVTGNIPAVTASSDGNFVNVPAGFHASEQRFPITVQGGGYDTSTVTASADTMLSGVIAIGKNGETITGNIPAVTASSDGEYVTVPAGFHASEQRFPITVQGGGYDTSGVTASADTMLSGVIAIGRNGETITGNIQTVTPNVNKNTFTVGKGYVAEAFSQTIAESGASTISGNKVTVPAGYLSTDRVATIPKATVTETENSVTITPGYVAEELTYSLGSDIDFTASDIWQITEYSPALPACTGISQIEVYETIKGQAEKSTYHVTPETERIADPFKRVYKNAADTYIWGECDAEYDEGRWFIGQNLDSPQYVCWTDGSNLKNGTYEFEDYDTGDMVEFTFEVFFTDYSASDAVIKGERTLNSGGVKHTFFTQYDIEPQTGRWYYAQNGLIGRAIDAGNGVMPEKLNLLTHWGHLKYQDRKFVDETGNCELRQLGSTDLYLETSQADSPFGNPLLFFNYFNSNEGAVLIKNLPKTSSFTIEFWALLPAERADLWGGTILANKTYWENTGEYDYSVMISASTDYTNAIYKQWYHHAFVCWYTPDTGPGATCCAVKEYINGQLVNTYGHHGYPFYDTKTEEVSRDVFLGGNSNEILFVPGGRDGKSSSRYVAQLAIWGRKLSEIDLAAIAQYKQPYHL